MTNSEFDSHFEEGESSIRAFIATSTYEHPGYQIAQAKIYRDIDEGGATLFYYIEDEMFDMPTFCSIQHFYLIYRRKTGDFPLLARDIQDSLGNSRLTIEQVVEFLEEADVRF